ncbi:MAG: SMC-Scp complex subunit ScpB [Clostridia bacterium]|nr:SMC-Scp complex subunit ScpB [Clostridia bacterium]
MEELTMCAKAEAVLFASGSPVPTARLMEILSLSLEELDEIIKMLDKKYKNAESGISLVLINDAYQLCTKTAAAEYVKKALELRKTPPLSKASLEVLAIIAYNQPVTRSFIEQVRGTDSSYIVNNLLEKGLIYEADRLDAPGRPVLLATTDNFLRCFGISSLDELPDPGVALSVENAAKNVQAEGQESFDSVLNSGEDQT